MVAKEQIKNRKDQYQREVEKLALERLKLTRRIEEIDKAVAQYETAIQVGDLALRDLDTEAAIAAAKETNG